MSDQEMLWLTLIGVAAIFMLGVIFGWIARAIVRERRMKQIAFVIDMCGNAYCAALINAENAKAKANHRVRPKACSTEESRKIKESLAKINKEAKA